MKKILLLTSVFAMMTLMCSAQTVKMGEKCYWFWAWNSETYTYEPSAEPVKYDDDVTCFYNEKGQKTVEIKGSAKICYYYNEDGTLARSERWSVSQANGAYITSYTDYTYADGKLAKDCTVSSGFYVTGNIYSNYDEQGNYNVKQSFSNDESNIESEYHYEYTYADDKSLTQKVELSQDWADKSVYNISAKYDYVYKEGKLISEAYSNYDTWSAAYTLNKTTTYSYDADGNCIQKADENASSGQIVYTDYVFGNIDTTKQVTGVEAIAMPNSVNQIYVKWNAVEGAEKYVVMYDNSIFEVTACEYLTPSLYDGTHYLAVSAVVNGIYQPISDFASASVKDETIQPCTNFRIEGTELEIDQWGNIYHINFAWDAPVTPATVTRYIIYIDKGDPTWIPSTNVDPDQTTGELANSKIVDCYKSSYMNYDENWNDAGNGPDCKIWVVAVYATGTSEKSNVIEMNIYDEITKAEATGVSSVEMNAGQKQMFTISGAKIANAANLPAGTVVIEKQGNSVKKYVK